jgi:hypothetical protein
MNPLRAVIRRFDGFLCRVEGVQEFTDDPDCILRVQVNRLNHPLHLAGNDISIGAEVLLIHLWNERILKIPDLGADLGWSVQVQRKMMRSFKLVARHMKLEQTLHDVQAIGGNTVLAAFETPNGGRTLLERLGFQFFPYRGSIGAFGEFWENFYTWWLMWAFNPASVRHRQLMDLKRAEFWMWVDDFIERFG